jgi:poly[ADP-ribose] polymerase 16
LKSVPKSEFPEILGKSPCVLKIIDPKYILEVNYDTDSNAEKRFQQLAENCSTNFAYHGTKFFLLHSILNFGLQQHLNKTGLFGEGIYLSHELSVSLPFSSAGLGWNKAKCGDFLSCVTLCEYVDDPVHVKIKKGSKKSDIPDKYLLVQNNDCLRIRYLLIYSHRSQTKRKSEEHHLITWCKKNFLFVALAIYAIILILIGLSNSRTGEYYKQIIFTKIYKAFENLQNVFIRK